MVLDAETFEDLEALGFDRIARLVLAVALLPGGGAAGDAAFAFAAVEAVGGEAGHGDGTGGCQKLSLQADANDTDGDIFLPEQPCEVSNQARRGKTSG